MYEEMEMLYKQFSDQKFRRLCNPTLSFHEKGLAWEGYFSADAAYVRVKERDRKLRMRIGRHVCLSFLFLHHFSAEISAIVIMQVSRL